MGGDRRSKLLEQAGWIGERLAGTPALTLGEVRSDLARRGIVVSHASVWRTVRKLGLRHKKRTLFATEQDRPDVAVTREIWRAAQVGLDFDRLVFVDETGTTTSMTRLRGWGRKGKPLLGKAPHTSLRERRGESPQGSGDESTLRKLLTRLTGSGDIPVTGDRPAPASDRQLANRLRDELNALWQLPPQQRGLRFETFLRDLFPAYGLRPRGAFKLHGEQIDGSFDLPREIYLIEAKWTQDPIAAADLRILQSKVEEKTTWTRGLFVSFAGFTSEGLAAFGRGKSVVCLSGKDIYEALNRGIHMAEVLERKVRHAAETGEPYATVARLHPTEK